MTIPRTKLQELCREAGLDGWADSVEHLSGLERVLEVLGEPTEAMQIRLTELGRTLISDRDQREDFTWFAVKAWRAMWSARLGDGG